MVRPYGVNVKMSVSDKNSIPIVCQARSQGGSGGSADNPLRTKGPLFGTSRVKLLRPITING